MDMKRRVAATLIAGWSICLLAVSTARAEPVALPPASVMDRAMVWLTQNQFSPSSIDRENGLLVAEKALAGNGRSRQWTNCPRRFNYREHTSYIKLTLVVRPSGEGSEVSLVGVFESEGPGMNWAINRFQCESNGKLEQEMLAALRAQ